jgi:uncharacterized protein YegL
MKTRIFNLIIIDESGSMECIKQQAIDSVNETIQSIRAAQQRNEHQDHFVTIVTFNDYVKTVNECVAVDEINELTAESYQPNCCTALYDAMGFSLTALQPKVAQDDKVLVTVVTDGYENASREYSSKAIKALVDQLKAQGWVFAYIGANHDVEVVAASLSITNTMCFETTDDGVKKMSERLSNSRACWYDKVENRTADSEEDNKSFFAKWFGK